MAALTLVVALAGCLYLYAGYPALLWVLSRLRPRPVRRAPIRPAVTLIVPVHNEEAVVEEKIRNSLALRYPPDRLEILIASDGSTDGTNAIARRYAGARVSLLELERRGKAAALNEAVRRARGEILVFSDANALLDPDALVALVENFADEEVGGVCGNKTLRAPAAGARPAAGRTDTTGAGENLYWRYDKWQKALESRIGSIFAADGSLHAVRRELYMPITDPAQADDIAISTRVVLQGRRLLFEPRAVAWEEAPADGRLEFWRKVRVTNHSVRALWNLGGALWTSGFYSVELLSHKFFRHLAPFFLVALAGASAARRGAHPIVGALWLGQLLFYGAALAGFLLRRTRAGRLRVLSVPYYFCLVNAAALVGVLSILAGVRRHAWSPRGGLRAGLAVALVLPALDAAAQPAGRVEGQVRLNSVAYGNFFQTPRGRPARNVWAGAVEARVGRRLEDRPHVLVFGEGDLVTYRGFTPSGGFAGGVRREGRHTLELAGRLHWNRPAAEVRDEFDRADVAGAGVEYAYRPARAVEIVAAGDWQRESYASAAAKNNHRYYAGGSVRYRGFGRRFSPEVGLTRGRRDAADDGEDFTQRELFVRVRSSATARVYVSGRYRHRLREYTIRDPARRNVGRVDRRHQLSGAVDVGLGQGVGLAVYYAWETARSTRTELDFATHLLSAGLVVRF